MMVLCVTCTNSKTTRDLTPLCAQSRFQALEVMFMATESCEGGNGARASGVVHTCNCKHCSILGSCNDTLLGTMCRGELDAFHQRVDHEDIVARERQRAEEYFTEEIMSISKSTRPWITPIAPWWRHASALEGAVAEREPWVAAACARLRVPPGPAAQCGHGRSGGSTVPIDQSNVAQPAQGFAEGRDSHCRGRLHSRVPGEPLRE